MMFLNVRSDTGSAPLSRPYSAGGEVHAVNTAEFYADYATESSHPGLIYRHSGQPHIYPDDIKDFEMAYALANRVVVDSPTTFSSVKEVNIELDARNRIADPEEGDDNFEDTFST